MNPADLKVSDHGIHTVGIKASVSNDENHFGGFATGIKRESRTVECLQDGCRPKPVNKIYAFDGLT